MKTICFLILGTLTLCSSSCSSKPSTLIVGNWKWTGASEEGILEFTKDEFSFQATKPKQSADAKKGRKYRFVDENTVQTEDESKVRFKVAVKNDELTITSADDGSREQLVWFVEGRLVLELPPPHGKYMTLQRVR
jgi:hypothetical protein